MWNARQDEAQVETKIAGRNINNLRYIDDTTLMTESEGTKVPLDESERGEWKSWLKSQHSKNLDHGIWSHHFMQIDRETVADFSSLGSKITANGNCSMKLKDSYCLEGKLWPT